MHSCVHMCKSMLLCIQMCKSAFLCIHMCKSAFLFIETSKSVFLCIQMQILHVISFIIERMQREICPHAAPLVQYLPQLWLESAEHNMLRCAILSTLMFLVQVRPPCRPQRYLYLGQGQLVKHCSTALTVVPSQSPPSPAFLQFLSPLPFWNPSLQVVFKCKFLYSTV